MLDGGGGAWPPADYGESCLRRLHSAFESLQNPEAELLYCMVVNGRHADDLGWTAAELAVDEREVLRRAATLWLKLSEGFRMEDKS